jgi:hypothetical protein
VAIGQIAESRLAAPHKGAADTYGRSAMKKTYHAPAITASDVVRATEIGFFLKTLIETNSRTTPFYAWGI